MKKFIKVLVFLSLGQVSLAFSAEPYAKHDPSDYFNRQPGNYLDTRNCDISTYPISGEYAFNSLGDNKNCDFGKDNGPHDVLKIHSNKDTCSVSVSRKFEDGIMNPFYSWSDFTIGIKVQKPKWDSPSVEFGTVKQNQLVLEIYHDTGLADKGESGVFTLKGNTLIAESNVNYFTVPVRCVFQKIK